MGETFAIKSGTRVGYLNAILAPGGGDLNEPIIKSSNSWGGLPSGMLKFGIAQCITLPKAFLWAFFF